MKTLLFIYLCLAWVPATAHADWVLTWDDSSCPDERDILGTRGTGGGQTYASQDACEDAVRSVTDSPGYAPCIQYRCTESGASGGGDSGGSLQQQTANALVKGVVNGNAQEFGYGLMGLGAMAVLNDINSAPAQPSAAEIAQAQEQQQLELAAQQLNNSGLWYMRQGNYAQAADEFRGALAKTPGDGDIANNLSIAERDLAFQNGKSEAQSDMKATVGSDAGDDDSLKDDLAPAQGRASSAGGGSEGLKDDSVVGGRPLTAPGGGGAEMLAVPPINTEGGAVFGDSEVSIADAEDAKTVAVEEPDLEASSEPAQAGVQAQTSVMEGVSEGGLDAKVDEAGVKEIERQADADGVELGEGGAERALAGGKAAVALARGDVNEAGSNGVDWAVAAIPNAAVSGAAGTGLSGGRIVGQTAKGAVINVFDGVNHAVESRGGPAADEGGEEQYNHMVESMPRGCQIIATTIGMGVE